MIICRGSFGSSFIIGAGERERGSALGDRAEIPRAPAGDWGLGGGRGGSVASEERGDSVSDTALLGERRLAGIVGILSEDSLRRVTGGGRDVGGASRPPFASLSNCAIAVSLRDA